MRRVMLGSVLLCALLLLPPAASAQTRGDFAAGYNVLHLLGQDGDPGLTFPAGFFISGAARVGRGVMLVGELADSTKSVTDFGVTASASYLTYAGGLRFTATDRRGPRESARPFVEILVGGARLSAAVEGQTLASGDAFAFLPGAGVDIPVTRRVAVRVAGHFEWLHSGGSAQAFRLDIGVAFRGGRR